SWRAPGPGPARRSAPPPPTPPRRFFATAGIAVDVIPISGAVEVAPRLGLAEAIVDLVSRASTLVINGLRPIADVLASEAVLVANPDAVVQRSTQIDALDTMF